MFWSSPPPRLQSKKLKGSGSSKQLRRQRLKSAARAATSPKTSLPRPPEQWVSQLESTSPPARIESVNLIHVWPNYRQRWNNLIVSQATHQDAGDVERVFGSFHKAHQGGLIHNTYRWVSSSTSSQPIIDIWSSQGQLLWCGLSTAHSSSSPRAHHWGRWRRGWRQPRRLLQGLLNATHLQLQPSTDWRTFIWTNFVPSHLISSNFISYKTKQVNIWPRLYPCWEIFCYCLSIAK